MKRNVLFVSKFILIFLVGTAFGFVAEKTSSTNPNSKNFKETVSHVGKNPENMTEEQSVDELLSQFADFKTICNTPPIHVDAAKDGRFSVKRIGVKKKEGCFASEFYVRNVITNKMVIVRNYNLDCSDRTIDCDIERDIKTNKMLSCCFEMTIKGSQEEKYLYGDTDADGMWDIFKIIEAVGDDFKETFHVRDGLTWKVKSVITRKRNPGEAM